MEELKKFPMISDEIYENLTLRNSFMFGKVMGKRKNSMEMIRRLTGNVLDENVTINNEKSLKIAHDSKEIRYDIFIEDSDKAMYDAEMQQRKNVKVLPKRSRLYQEMMDLGYMETGADYITLPDSYVIFICTFDPFNEGLCCYSFENICLGMSDNKHISLGDGRKILIFNTVGTTINVSTEVYNVLRYIETGDITDEYTQTLDVDVCDARRNKEWRSEYMRFSCNEADAKREGREQGFKAGKLEGKLEIARNMKLANAPIQFIVKTTGLSEKEIEDL